MFKNAVAFLTIFMISQMAQSNACIGTTDLGPKLGEVKVCTLLNPTAKIPPKDFCKRTSAKPGQPSFNDKYQIVDACPGSWVAKCEKSGASIKKTLSKIPRNKKVSGYAKNLSDTQTITTHYYSLEVAKLYESSCLNGKWTKK